MAAAADRDEELNEMLKCSICIDVFTDPRTLPCLHTFCFECIARWITRDPEKEDLKEDVTCPMCRGESAIPKNGIVGLPKNPMFCLDEMKSVLEELESDSPQLLFTLDQPPTDVNGYPHRVRGVAILDKYICVVYDKHNKVEVFNCEDLFKYVKDILISEASSPFAMVGCSMTSQLFISEWTNENIWRVTVNTGVCDVFIKLDRNSPKWISLAENRLLVTSQSGHALLVYDIQSGERMTSIPYTEDLEKYAIEHTIESNRDTFFVCHLIGLNTVFEVDSEGGVIKVFDNEEPLHCSCIYLALDSVGGLLVVDYNKQRVVLLDEHLQFVKILLDRERFDYAWPLTVNFDTSSKRLAVGLNNGYVKIFTL